LVVVSDVGLESRLNSGCALTSKSLSADESCNCGIALGCGGKRDGHVDSMKNRKFLSIMQQLDGELQQSDVEPEPDHLLILVHGILAKYVTLPHRIV
jgi:hypothetical protein